LSIFCNDSATDEMTGGNKKNNFCLLCRISLPGRQSSIDNPQEAMLEKWQNLS